MIIGTEVLRYLAYKPAAFHEKIQPFIRRIVGASEFSTSECLVLCNILMFTWIQKHSPKNVLSFQLSTSHT